MSELPSGWAMAQTREVGWVQLGRQRSPVNHFGDHMRKYLRVANVFENRIDVKDVAEMNFSPADFERFRLIEGDILLNEGQSRELVGRPAIFRNEVPDACFQNTLVRFRAGDLVVPEFALALFRRYFHDGTFQRVSQWTTNIAHLGAERFGELSFPLPPLNEQRRIADKLDVLLAQVDACRERLDRVSAIVKRFRQAVLAAATSGRLTEDWRTDRRPTDAWQERQIQELAQVGTGSTPLRSNKAYYTANGIPWITSAATSQNLVLEAQEYVTQAAIDAHRLKRYPIGTLLVAMYGEGKTRGQVTELGIEATINQACAAIVVRDQDALKAYVKLVLQRNYDEMRRLAEGGNQPNLNLAKIKEFPLPLPSAEEQQEIVRRVELLFSYADRLEQRIQATRARVERLTPALLAKAFRGELVPQDPNDESAEVLLERLRQSAGDGETKRRPGRKSASR